MSPANNWDRKGKLHYQEARRKGVPHTGGIRVAVANSSDGFLSAPCPISIERLTAGHKRSDQEMRGLGIGQGSHSGALADQILIGQVKSVRGLSSFRIDPMAS